MQSVLFEGVEDGEPFPPSTDQDEVPPGVDPGLDPLTARKYKMKQLAAKSAKEALNQATKDGNIELLWIIKMLPY